MAQTWRVTPAKVAVFRLIDALALPLRPFVRTSPPRGEVRSILVMEPWHIGDVVLATPALRALRQRFPDARLSLLGKPHAEEILRHCGLVDEVIVFDLPWTSKTAKYAPGRYDVGALKELIGTLRSRQFDLTVDARMDLRSNVVTYLTGAPRRIGYDFGGGSFLLTDRIAADPDRRHRVDDWLELLRPLGITDKFEPLLRVTDDERSRAAATLASHGFVPGDTIVAIHGGASDARRQWPEENYERVAARLSASGATIVYFPEPGSAHREVSFASATIRCSLREMMAILTHCRLVVCNDSGPMHIADALGVPVVAVFLTGNPVWHRPYRDGQQVVGKGTGHDFLVAPTIEEVTAAAESELSRVVNTSRVSLHSR
jgi:ADP-heptose:LPS heptosyltransferase